MKKIKSLSEQTYDYIVRKIQLGDLQAGEKISETALIEELNISRTPIREALIQLAADNILENIQRKGFFVKSVSIAEMSQNFSIVARLDAYAAELALEYLDEKHLKKMESIVQRMDEAIEQQDYELYSNEQDFFHNIYVELCGNQQLIDLLYTLKHKFARGTILSNNKQKLFKLLYIVNQDHYKIIECFRQADVEKLRTTLFNHWEIAKINHDEDYF